MNKLAEVVVLTLAAVFSLKINALRRAKEKVATCKKANELARAKSIEAKSKVSAARAAKQQAVEEANRLQIAYNEVLHEFELEQQYVDASLDEAQLAAEPFLAARFEAGDWKSLEKAADEKLATSKAATAELRKLGVKNIKANDEFRVAIAEAKTKMGAYVAAAKESITRAKAEVEAATMLLAAEEAYSLELAGFSSDF